MIFPVFNQPCFGFCSFPCAHPVTLECEGCCLLAPLCRARAPLEPRANQSSVLAVVRPLQHGGDALPELHKILLSLLLPLRGQLQPALGQVDIE